MCSVRIARIGIEHLLGVAVVCRDEQDVPSLFTCFVDDANRLVCLCNRLYSSIKYARMAYLTRAYTTLAAVTLERAKRDYHIRGGKVAHDKIMLAHCDDL